MPTFQLSKRELLLPPAPTLTLARIEAVMLWPDDEQARREYTEAVAVRYAADNAPPGLAFEAADLRWLADATPLATIQQQRVKPRYRDGCLVGHIVCSLIDPAAGEKAKTLAEAKKAAVRAFGNALARSHDVKHVDNIIWPALRPVAHLWAAYIGTMRRTGQHAFPCPDDELADFLALANLMLREGAAYKAPRAPVPLLDAATAWQPPTGIIPALPAVAFK